MDDADIVRAAQQGSIAAITAMYDTHGTRVHDAALAMLRDRAGALETTYDTFVSAAERIHGLEDPHRLQAWLLAITRYQAARRAGAVAGPDRLPLLPASSDPEQAESTNSVWEASAHLPLRDRSMLDLSLRQGQDGEDLADSMGVTLTQAYDLQSRMRDRTEKALSGFLVAHAEPGRFPELEKVTRAWEGGFNRKIERHLADTVERDRTVNQARFSLPSPFALYAAGPVAAAPPYVRERVLEHAAIPVPGPDGTIALPPGAEPWLPNGFPPPSFVIEEERTRRSGPFLWVAAAVVLALVLIAGVLWALSGDDDPTDVATDTSTTLNVNPTPPSLPGGSTTFPSVTATTTASIPGVTTTIAPAAPARLVLSATDVRIPDNASSAGVTLRNTGGTPTSFAFTSSGVTVTSNPASGNIQPGEQVSIALNISRESIQEGRDIRIPFKFTSGAGDVGGTIITNNLKGPPTISNVQTTVNPCSQQWRVEANVSDPSGIQPNSVIATIDPQGTDEPPAGTHQMVPAGGSVFQTEVLQAAIGTGKFVEISVKAKDVHGQEAISAKVRVPATGLCP